MGSVFTSVDHDKFKALSITHLAARFEGMEAEAAFVEDSASSPRNGMSGRSFDARL